MPCPRLAGPGLKVRRSLADKLLAHLSFHVRKEQTMSATVIQMDSWKLRASAREYVRRFVEYGFECAAMWSIDHVRDTDSASFNRFVREEMRKRGFAG
jgi:hypothetical protein